MNLEEDNMNLEEMKLLVYKKIPREVIMQRDWIFAFLNWDDVGLQVCHEAERLMKAPEKNPDRWSLWMRYTNQLAKLMPQQYRDDKLVNAIHATYEQRLEALCRVWYPERFSK